MSQDNVKSFATEAFKKRLSTLAGQKEISDTDFADAVYTAMTSFGVDETQFRNEFGLTKGAVDRWTMLQNMPQTMIRGKILGWILQKI